MKIFWAIIGVVVLALAGVSVWASIFIVAATWLVAAAVAKSTNDNNEQENKQQSNIDSRIHSHHQPVTPPKVSYTEKEPADSTATIKPLEKITSSQIPFKDKVDLADKEQIANIIRSLLEYKQALECKEPGKITEIADLHIEDEARSQIGNIVYSLSEWKKNTEPAPGKESDNKDISAILQNLKAKIENLGFNISIGAGIAGGDTVSADESIIDVTGEYVKIDRTANAEEPVKVPDGIPYWEKEYIFSTRSLDSARTEVRRFYKKYKEAFLAGIYYDLGGNDNSNYFFTLMFDLLQEYDKQPNLTLLTRQMRALSEHYPETKYYAERNLIERAKKSGRRRAQCGEGEISIDDLVILFPDSREWSFADKYADKLNLAPKECDLFDYLNSQWDSMYSNFEFMKIKHVQLYRDVIKAVKETYIADGKSFEKALTDTAESFNIKGRNGRYDYGRSIYIYDNLPTAEKIKMIHNCIFRHCRNKLYDRYELHWPIELFSHEHYAGSKSAITKLLKDIEPIIVSVVETLPEFTDEEEIIVNNSYTTRWRTFYQQIIDSFNGDIQEYMGSVAKLAKQNSNNSGLRHLTLDVSKFLVGKDDIAALKMYLQYVDAHRKFSNDDEKPLPKYICKKLFKKVEQQDEFENIVRQYKADRDRKKAHEVIDQLFLPKRKKLNLDREEIAKISEQHSETVQLLNEVMSEEEMAIRTPEFQQNIVEPESNANDPIQQTNIQLDSPHMELLDIFVRNNHSLAKSQVANFAKSKGLMANRLIEKINELCYDTLDDVLIEDEDDNWTISEDYLKKIIS